jgi:hypothetical protein
MGSKRSNQTSKLTKLKLFRNLIEKKNSTFFQTLVASKLISKSKLLMKPHKKETQFSG